jgi:tetratricopeptide (TPR) repeat protein
MKSLISILIIIIGSSLSLSAQVNLDSLWTVWNDPNQPDNIRLQAIDNVAWDGYLFSQPDSAYYFSQLQYEYAKSKGLKKQMATALNTQGTSFRFRGNYSSAIEYYIQSLTISEEIGDKKAIASSLNNIGIIHEAQGNYALAIKYNKQSLAIKEEIGNREGIAASLNNIGVIHDAQGNYDLAIQYYTRGLTIWEEFADKRNIAFAFNNIGNIYYQQGDYISSNDYLTRSLTIREEIGDKQGAALCLNNIGNIYYQQGDYISANDYHTRSLKIREEIGDKQGIATCLNKLGIIYYTQGNFNYALINNIRSLKIAHEIGAVVQIRDAAHALYKIYKSTNKSLNALEMHELYISTRDSILSEENQREVIRQEYKYNYQKQALADSVKNAQAIHVQEVLVAAEISKNQRKQQQAYFLYGGIMLLLSLLVLLYNGFRVATKRKKIIEKQKFFVDGANYELIEKNHEIQAQADMINEANEEIKLINESLESTVKERTGKIELQNSKLREYSFSNSHEVRAPLARLIGLIYLWNDKRVTSGDRDSLIEKISHAAFELEEIVKKVSVLLNEDDNDAI